MSMISTDMVKVRLGSKILTLSEFITMSGESIPVGVFGLPVSTSSINKAISFLQGIGGGTTVINPTSSYNRLKIRVQVVNNSCLVFYTYENYRQPLNAEARPWTGESWEVGDYIVNTNVEDTEGQIAGWVCVKRGIPGTWQPCLNYGGITDKYVVATRERAEGKPLYGTDDYVEPTERIIPIILNVSPFSGETEISAFVNGTEYDADNLSSNRDTLSDGIILIQKLEE